MNTETQTTKNAFLVCELFDVYFQLLLKVLSCSSKYTNYSRVSTCTYQVFPHDWYDSVQLGYQVRTVIK